MKASCRILFSALLAMVFLFWTSAIAQNQNTQDQNGSQAVPPANQQSHQESMEGQESQNNAHFPTVLFVPGRWTKRAPPGGVARR
jgi:hypothetical protein